MSGDAKPIEWAEWTCPVCVVSMDDPVTVNATVCANGHTVYLGTVHRGPHGSARCAYKTKRDRSRAQRVEREKHLLYAEIMNFSVKNKV